MGLLDKLWDDTLAGPRPEKGLSRLRKYVPSSPSAVDGVPITRSITIVKTATFRNALADSGSLPSSPASSIGCDSPMTPMTPIGEQSQIRRKTLSGASERAEPRTPTVFDWYP
ncbi:hypothetical protein H6P81_015044 [Aristolochia fimbriata]|uniref:Uncharacterized protein n=1 Tax=Aristolochia fimbriata TaxID=158543 RepID=A0AAV7E4G6_ARIFI|nr:hypothetical protein H6P81_015044 [Aristolochia fimbriata]